MYNYKYAWEFLELLYDLSRVILKLGKNFGDWIERILEM